MADLNPWLVATLALLPPFAVAVLFCLHGDLGRRLGALQLVTSSGALVLAAMTFALAQPSSIDLALTLALLAVPATLLFALFLERLL